MQNLSDKEDVLCDYNIQDIKNLICENRKLNEIIDERNQLDAKKEIFLATLIHDLKNPLLAQIRSLQMLSDGMYGEVSLKQKNIIGVTLESIRFVDELLDSIMTSYKYDNGVIVLDKNSFDVEVLMQNCINEIQVLAGDKNIEIQLNSELESDERWLFADICQIRRVISNILNNSINYAFRGTKIRINISKNNNRLIFEIENSSPEIPADIQEHLFEKYVSGSDIYHRTGSGLGLYLARKIIEAHNGKIYLTANSTDNRFTFEIPIEEHTNKTV